MSLYIKHGCSRWGACLRAAMWMLHPRAVEAWVCRSIDVRGYSVTVWLESAA